MAAQMGGVEHPTILHLHLARLLLLTPVITIQNTARLFLNSSKSLSISVTSPSSRFKYKAEIMHWLSQDQYKARLSMVHAGAIFWYVRRYSCDGMIEPFAVYLASLVLWAYATFPPQPDKQREMTQDHGRQAAVNQPNSSSLENPTSSSLTLVDPISARSSSVRLTPSEQVNFPDPPFIQLDRPCDDELVQTFVRHGDHMTCYMSRIGNICDPRGGPQKVLREGVNFLLRSGSHICRMTTNNDETFSAERMKPTWGVAEKYAEILED
ncbi:hypothetical protein F5884DRAFT_135797 [Xylogone sp. PMI_703]|nr:hypothetical protein F5884DRAFT_135797 [Xylogone sp. PMI_703]